MKSDFLGGLRERRRRRQAIDQAQFERFARANGTAREHQVHRGEGAGELHGANRSAQARVHAKLHFRKAQRDAGVVGDHAIAARQRQFEPAAQSKPIDRSDGDAR
jgi:hypothetical protein